MPGAEGREVLWFALLSLPSRNSSNKCTFHTKVSLLVVLLSLDPPLVDCKLKSLCDSKAVLLQMPSSEDGLKLGSCLQCVWQPMCLYLLPNLQAFIYVFITVKGTEVLQRESMQAYDAVVLHPLPRCSFLTA